MLFAGGNQIDKDLEIESAKMEKNKNMFGERMEATLATHLPDSQVPLQEVEEAFTNLLFTIERAMAKDIESVTNSRLRRWKPALKLYRIVVDLFPIIPAPIKENFINKGLYEQQPKAQK